MNTDSYLTILVAVSCIAAAGVSAATLDSTITTNPDDVIQLEYDRLPIGTDDAEEIDNEVESNKGQGQNQAAGGSGDGTVQGPSDSEESGSSEDTGGDDGQLGGSAGGKEGNAGGGGGGEGPNGHGTAMPWSLLDLLRPLLAVLGVLAVGLLAYRYRRRLLAAAAGLWTLLAGGRSASVVEDEEPWPPGRPDDEIHRAWLRMVEGLDIDRPHARTPIECGEAAVEAGMDADAVSTLTRVFRDVRYGGAQATDDRVERARESLRALDRGRRGGPT